MRFVAITCALSVVCLSLSMRPALQGEPNTKPTLPAGSKAAIQALVDEMQGTWRLMKLDSPTLDKQRRQETGFMLISGNYFSFEMHMSWTSLNNQGEKRSFISGTHRFEIDERSRLTANSVIGSAIDDDGRVLFEQPGHARQYDVTCAGTTLKLKRDDGTTLEFERLSDSKMTRDIYGRPLKVKDPNAPAEPPPEKKDGLPKKN